MGLLFLVTLSGDIWLRSGVWLPGRSVLIQVAQRLLWYLIVVRHLMMWFVYTILTAHLSEQIKGGETGEAGNAGQHRRVGSGA